MGDRFDRCLERPGAAPALRHTHRKDVHVQEQPTRERRAAERDARAVDGVYEVMNHLKVNLRGADRREDDEIRGAALQQLTWDAEVPSDSIEVNVQDGWVTIKGDVSFQFQTDAAYDDVSKLYG